VEALWVSRELGLNRFVSEQPPYNILDRRIERELVPMAETFGIGLIPWSPIGGGLLTGKYRRGAGMPADSRYATENNPVYEQRLNERVYDVVERLEVMAQAKDCTMVQLAVAWVVGQVEPRGSASDRRARPTWRHGVAVLPGRVRAASAAGPVGYAEVRAWGRS
jgi:aryl-alcohol dehydrogenase-like predicted oxidoreductase